MAGTNGPTSAAGSGEEPNPKATSPDQPVKKPDTGDETKPGAETSQDQNEDG